MNAGNAPVSSLENTSLPFTVTSNEAVLKKGNGLEHYKFGSENSNLNSFGTLRLSTSMEMTNFYFHKSVNKHSFITKALPNIA